MRDIKSYGVHKPNPGRKAPTGLHHIARTPIKTGASSSGGGTTKGGGMVKTHGGGTGPGRSRGGKGRSAFKMPRPDKYGYY